LISFFASSNKLTITAGADSNLQTLKVNDKTDLQIKKSKEKGTVDLTKIEKKVNDLFKITSPKSNLTFGSDGVYAITADGYFLPAIVNSVELDDFADFEEISQNVDYILTTLPPVKSGDWIQANVTIDPKLISIVKDSVFFSLEIPELDKHGGSLEIANLDIILKDKAVPTSTPAPTSTPKPTAVPTSKPTLVPTKVVPTTAGSTGSPLNSSELETEPTEVKMSLIQRFFNLFKKNKIEPTSTPTFIEIETISPTMIPVVTETGVPSISPTPTSTPSATPTITPTLTVTPTGSTGSPSSISPTPTLIIEAEVVLEPIESEVPFWQRIKNFFGQMIKRPMPTMTPEPSIAPTLTPVVTATGTPTPEFCLSTTYKLAIGVSFWGKDNCSICYCEAGAKIRCDSKNCIKKP
jgi:hypothetical protein